MRLIDADAIYPWYMDAFDFDPNEVRFSMNDIRDNLDNIPTHPTPSNTLGALDCVERQAVIDALDEIRHALWEIDIPSHTVPEYVEHHEQVQSVWKLLDKKQKELYVLPYAQPERKKGEWIRNDNDTYSCSVCQSWIPEEQHYYARYCLYCSADMRGEQE